MQKALKNYILNMLAKLSPEERQEVIGYFLDSELSNEIDLENTINKIRESRFNEGLACPHCHNDDIIKHGKTNKQQRYRCKSCGRTFTDFTGTPIEKIKKKKEFFKSLQCMLEGKSLPKTAEEVGVTIPTAFDWRHKVLSALKSKKNDKLAGVVEVDDTYFLHSEKGNPNLKRKPRKRGGKAKKRGISNEQVCVIVGLDRNGNSISKIACHGRPSAVDVNNVLRMNEDGEIILCTDKHPSLGKYANMNNFKHVELNLSKDIRVIKNIYHIQNVNGYHSRLKEWLRRFKGVSTKYLDNYLSWFDFVDRAGRDVKKETAKRQLMTTVCSPVAA